MCRNSDREPSADKTASRPSIAVSPRLAEGHPPQRYEGARDHPYRLRATGERRNVMHKLQGLPNNFTARAASGAEDNNFHLAFPG